MATYAIIGSVSLGQGCLQAEWNQNKCLVAAVCATLCTEGRCDAASSRWRQPSAFTSGLQGSCFGTIAENRLTAGLILPDIPNMLLRCATWFRIDFFFLVACFFPSAWPVLSASRTAVSIKLRLWMTTEVANFTWSPAQKGLYDSPPRKGKGTLPC